MSFSNNKNIDFQREPSIDPFDYKHSADILSRLLFGDPRDNSETSNFKTQIFDNTNSQKIEDFPRDTHDYSSFSSDRVSNIDFMNSNKFAEDEDPTNIRNCPQNSGSINLLDYSYHASNSASEGQRKSLNNQVKHGPGISQDKKNLKLKTDLRSSILSPGSSMDVSEFINNENISHIIANDSHLGQLNNPVEIDKSHSKLSLKNSRNFKEGEDSFMDRQSIQDRRSDPNVKIPTSLENNNDEYRYHLLQKQKQQEKEEMIKIEVQQSYEYQQNDKFMMYRNPSEDPMRIQTIIEVNEDLFNSSEFTSAGGTREHNRPTNQSIEDVESIDFDRFGSAASLTQQNMVKSASMPSNQNKISPLTSFVIKENQPKDIKWTQKSSKDIPNKTMGVMLELSNQNELNFGSFSINSYKNIPCQVIRLSRFMRRLFKVKQIKTKEKTQIEDLDRVSKTESHHQRGMNNFGSEMSESESLVSSSHLSSASEAHSLRFSGLTHNLDSCKFGAIKEEVQNPYEYPKEGGVHQDQSDTITGVLEERRNKFRSQINSSVGSGLFANCGLVQKQKVNNVELNSEGITQMVYSSGESSDCNYLSKIVQRISKGDNLQGNQRESHLAENSNTKINNPQQIISQQNSKKDITTTDIKSESQSSITGIRELKYSENNKEELQDQLIAIELDQDKEVIDPTFIKNNSIEQNSQRETAYFKALDIDSKFKNEVKTVRIIYSNLYLAR